MHLFQVSLCGIDGRNQQFFNFNALIQQGLFLIITAFNLQLRNKVRSAMGIKGFPNICADACTGTNKLIRQDRFFFPSLPHYTP